MDARCRLRSYGFVLDQESAIEKYGIEKFSVGEFDTYQVSLADIADAAGVTFRQQLLEADAFQGSVHESRGPRRGSSRCETSWSKAGEGLPRRGSRCRSGPGRGPEQTFESPAAP